MIELFGLFKAENDSKIKVSVGELSVARDCERLQYIWRTGGKGHAWGVEPDHLCRL